MARAQATNMPADRLMSEDPAAALRVVEVGAGNGELAHYLRRALHDGGGGGASFSVVACDDNADTYRPTTFGRVERMDYREALKVYRPHLVVCSWMPMAVDWTADFRRCPTVGEYLLLGECYDGACGHNFLTWGNPDFTAAPDGAGDGRISPPHESDGWHTEEVHALSRWMLSRFASDSADCECLSTAIAFRRGR